MSDQSANILNWPRTHAQVSVRPEEPRDSGMGWQCKQPHRKHGVGVPLAFSIGTPFCQNLYRGSCGECLPEAVLVASIDIAKEERKERSRPKLTEEQKADLFFSYIESWERGQCGEPIADPEHPKEEAELAALLTPAEKAARDAEEEVKYSVWHGAALNHDKEYVVVAEGSNGPEGVVFGSDSCIEAVKHLWSLHVAEKAV